MIMNEAYNTKCFLSTGVVFCFVTEPTVTSIDTLKE